MTGKKGSRRDGKPGPLDHFFAALSKKYPDQKKHIEAANGMAENGIAMLDKAFPTCEHYYAKACESVAKAREYDLDEFTPLIAGLGVCFFGGCFSMLIALVEVVRLTSWDRIQASLHTLYENYNVALEASRKDDMVDADNNGIPDVQEISREKLLSRKVTLFLTSVNPVDVSEALNTLFLAFLSILAALRDKLANTITFGCAFADTLRQFFPLEKALEDALPEKQKKLAGTIAGAGFNFFGMTVASIARPYITAMHCATSGATLFARHAITLGKERGFLAESWNMEDQRATAFILALAFLGFFWQVSNDFTLAFPFSVLLFPLTAADWIVSTVFRTSSSIVNA